MFNRRSDPTRRRHPKLFTAVAIAGLIMCATVMFLTFSVFEAVVARPRSPAVPLVETQVIVEKVDATQAAAPVPPTEAPAATGTPEHRPQAGGESKVHIPVVVVTCKRAEYLDRSLEALTKYMPPNGELGNVQFSIIVSRDCNDDRVDKVIASPKYAGKITNMRFRPPEGRIQGHEAVARHYGWLFTQVFDVLHYEAAVVVEEDMEVSPDFYEYFAAGYDLLRSSSSDFMCVSAWNDNGLKSIADDVYALYITDIFPGLGWMMLRELWDQEIRARWPKGYWDEFMRAPDVRKGRVCVRPEVSRSFNYGEDGGVNKGQFFKSHLAHILRNTENVQWTQIDKNVNPFYNGSLVKRNFDRFLYDVIKKDSKAIRVQNPGSLTTMKNEKEGVQVDVVTQYTKENYPAVAKMFGLMKDLKEGHPRGSYKNVLIFKWHGFRVFLALNTVYENPEILLEEER